MRCDVAAHLEDDLRVFRQRDRPRFAVPATAADEHADAVAKRQECRRRQPPSPDAKQIAERGHFLSIPSNARRSEGFTRMISSLPRDQILLETDCPYMPAVVGEDSEPAHVAGTAQYAAELWNVSLAEAQAQLERNFEALFRVAP